MIASMFLYNGVARYNGRIQFRIQIAAHTIKLAQQAAQEWGEAHTQLPVRWELARTDNRNPDRPLIGLVRYRASSKLDSGPGRR